METKLIVQEEHEQLDRPGVGQTEGEKREKEEQVACCEAYIDGMKAKLQACQHFIHSQEGSLQEEMLRLAPLYGACLEALSMEELEIIWCIHEEGADSCHFNRVKVLASLVALVKFLVLLLRHLMKFLVLLLRHLPWLSEPPSLVPNGGVGIHSNGHMNGAVGSPWFNHALTPQRLVDPFCQLR